MIDLIVPCFRRDNDYQFWLAYGPILFDSYRLSSIILGRGPFVLVLSRSTWTGRLSWSHYSSPRISLLSGLCLDFWYSKAILQIQSFAFASADYLFFLDCDLRITRESLQCLVDTLARYRSKGIAVYIGMYTKANRLALHFFGQEKCPCYLSLMTVADVYRSNGGLLRILVLALAMSSVGVNIMSVVEGMMRDTAHMDGKTMIC
jgi:hypothetical protein